MFLFRIIAIGAWTRLTPQQKLAHAIDTIPGIEIPEPTIRRDRPNLCDADPVFDHTNRTSTVYLSISGSLFRSPLDHQAILEMVLVHMASRDRDLTEALAAVELAYPQVLVAMYELSQRLRDRAPLHELTGIITRIQTLLPDGDKINLPIIITAGNIQSVLSDIGKVGERYSREVESDIRQQVEAFRPAPLRSVRAYYAQIAYGIREHGVDHLDLATVAGRNIQHATQMFVRTLTADFMRLSPALKLELWLGWDERTTTFLVAQGLSPTATPQL